MTKIKTKSFGLSVLTRGNEGAKKLALIIPGRLDTKDYANFVSHAALLSSKGYYAVACDPPGVWGSDGGISTYTTTNYVKAIDELIEYFGKKPTLLVGHSRGGAVAMLSAAKNDVVQGVVPILASFGAPSPPKQSTIDAGFELDYRDTPPGTYKTKEQKEFKLPLNYFRDGEQYRPGEALKRVAIPKLLILSKQDEFMQIDNVYKTIEESPDPKMVIELDCEHDYRYHPEAIEAVDKAIAEFVEKYLNLS